MSFQDSSDPPGPSPQTCAPALAPAPDASPHNSETSIARLFEMTSDLLATISHDGYFTLLNPAWEKLLGWTREELQAAAIHEFLRSDD